MPNTPVPATGEAMPGANITRRTVLGGLAGASAAGLGLAIPAAGELCPAEGSRWIIAGSGKVWTRPYLRLSRLDLVREPDGLGLTERMLDVWDSVNGMAGSARS